MRTSRQRPSVMMVTGAYYPELSGGGLQARAVVRAIGGDAVFRVLTTTIDRALPSWAVENGVPIRRVFVDLGRPVSRVAALFRLASAFLRDASGIDVVNLHGFSTKAVLLLALSRLLRKKFILTLQTGVHDEPQAARAAGSLAYWAYTGADLYLSVSPGLSRAYLDAGLDPARLRQVCNAVDTARFQPADASTRAARRAALRLPADLPIVLFVGFFSRDKRPHLLYDAWLACRARSALVLVGATRSRYGEIDPELASGIARRAAADGVSDRVVFVESTTEIEQYFQAADVYALPSVREGFPIALLEAMSSGLACVASRLPGSTDVIVEDGVNGMLVLPDDVAAFTRALELLLTDRQAALRLASAARATIVSRYSIDRTAPLWLAAYREASANGAAPSKP